MEVYKRCDMVTVFKISDL